MLELKALHATVANKAILSGPSLTVNPGEVDAIMGQNGAGTSTLIRCSTDDTRERSAG